MKQCQRLSSTTTRIKTAVVWLGEQHLERQRLSSTTTRIKTPAVVWLGEQHLEVRDYLPLQQGLRQVSIVYYRDFKLLSETIFHYNKD